MDTVTTFDESGRPFETIYGYRITEYKCECLPKSSTDCSMGTIVWWRDGWHRCLFGVSYSWLSGEQTPELIRKAHQNVAPLIPPVIRGLIEKISYWELRALRAEADLTSTREKL